MASKWHRLATAFTLAWVLAIGSVAAQDPKGVGTSNKYPVEIVPSVGGGTSKPIAITRDGRFAAIASGNGAQLWDLEKGRLVRKLTGLMSLAQSVDISPDGTRIAAGEYGGTILIWDAATGRVTASFNVDMTEVTGVAFSSDGSRLAYAGNPRTELGERAKPSTFIREIASGRVIQSHFSPAHGGFGSVTRLAVSSDRSMVAVGDNDGTMRVFSFEGGAARPLAGHKCSTAHCTVLSLAFSPDGKSLASGSYDATAKIWDVATGKLMRSLPAQGGTTPGAYAVSWSTDGNTLAVTDNAGALRLWNPRTGEGGATTTFRSKYGKAETVYGAVHLPDGKSLLLAVNGLTLVDAQTLQVARSIMGAGLSAYIVTIPHTYGDAVAVSGGSRSILSVNLAEVRVQRATYGAEGEWWYDVRGSRDGSRLIGVDGKDHDAVITAERDRPSSTKVVLSGLKVPHIALSPEGRTGFLFARNKGAFLFDAQTGATIRRLSDYKEGPGQLVGLISLSDFSPDGRLLVTHDLDRSLKVWDVASGRTLAATKTYAWQLKFLPDGKSFLVTGAGLGEYAIEHRSADGARLLRRMQLPGGNSIINAVDVHPREKLAIVSGHDSILRLWNLSTGGLLREYRGHTTPVSHVAFARDASRIVSGASDGLKVWNTDTGELLLSYFITNDTDWVAITPDGFFDASGSGAQALSIVKGLDVYSIDQAFEHLYRPDLVEARLKGDPEGKYKNAAHKLNIEAVLNSGPAPQIEHLPEKDDRAGDSVRLSVRITGRGGGVGKRIVWRVNGVTQGTMAPEVLATNETPLASVVVTEALKLIPGQANMVEVTAYNRAGLVATPPLRITIDKFGATTEARPRMFVLALGVDNYRMREYRLNYAAHDARSLAKALEVVGSGLFAEVKTKALTDEQVNEAGIAAAVEEMARVARPEDVFVLFLGGHGKSIAGRYYYYPQTIEFSRGHTVEQHGIGQDKWEAWLARIAVQKSLLVIDTCEGDAFRGSRGEDATRQTAMAQLQHATGRNIIAAARDAAFEGHKGHGLLTYAILEALDKTAGAGGDDRVRVAALADHVGVRVPEISQKTFGIYQNPTRKLSGNDFPIGIRQSVLASDGPTIPSEPTHVLIRAELLREKPEANSPGSRQLPPGSHVRAVEFVGDWVIIARDGQKLGYVPAQALARIQ